MAANTPSTEVYSLHSPIHRNKTAFKRRMAALGYNNNVARRRTRRRPNKRGGSTATSSPGGSGSIASSSSLPATTRTPTVPATSSVARLGVSLIVGLLLTTTTMLSSRVHGFRTSTTVGSATTRAAPLSPTAAFFVVDLHRSGRGSLVAPTTAPAGSTGSARNNGGRGLISSTGSRTTASATATSLNMFMGSDGGILGIGGPELVRFDDDSDKIPAS